MKLITTTTLRGKGDDGMYAHWPKGCIFDDSVDPIPKDIMSEFEAETGTLVEISNGGGSAKPTSKPKAKSSSTIADNKKAGRKVAAKKTVAATKPPVKAKKKNSAKKNKRKSL